MNLLEDILGQNFLDPRMASVRKDNSKTLAEWNTDVKTYNCFCDLCIAIDVNNGISIKDTITEFGVLQFCIITRKTTNWFYTTQ